jgi:outer membrane protein TolC
MKNTFLFLLSLSVVWEVNAQSEAKNYTLRQCIDYALANNTSIKNATIDEYIAKAKVGETTSLGLPQINGSVGLQHANPLRAFFGKGNGQPSLFAGGAVIPDGVVYSAPNFFQLPNSFDASITVTQLIFSSSYIIGLQAARTYKALSAVSKENTKIQVVENVTKAYYMYLVNVQRQNLFDANIARLDSLLKQTKANSKAGFVEQIDVDRLEVTYNNLITERDKFTNMLVLSGLLLKFQMGMPMSESLTLTDKIENVSLDSNSVSSESANFANRTEYKLLETQLRLNTLNNKNEKYSFLPSIQASANLGRFSQSDKFNFFKNGHPWANYGIYSIGANIPIFDGLGKVKRVQQSKLELEKTENNMIQFKQVVDLEAKSSELTFKNNIKSLKVQQRNLNLAKEVVRVSQIKYKTGVGSNIEVITAESSLKESQVNYYNALYEAIVAKVDYDKALGNLK